MIEKHENSRNFVLYCHFYTQVTGAVFKTKKIIFPFNSNLHIIDLKGLIAKALDSDKEITSTPYKIISVKKTLSSSDPLLDSLKISQFFDNKDDIFCGVELNIQPVKVNTFEQNDVLKFKTLTNYSFWVANKQIVKVRVPLDGCQNLNKEHLKASFTESSLEVKILNLNGNNYCFGVPRLDAKIVPEKSEAFIDKDGSIIIRLRKAKEDDHWSYLFKQKYVGEN